MKIALVTSMYANNDVGGGAERTGQTVAEMLVKGARVPLLGNPLSIYWKGRHEPSLAAKPVFTAGCERVSGG